MQNFEFYLDAFAQDKLIFLFLPIFLLALIVELVIDQRSRLGLYEFNDARASLWMTVFVVIVDILPKFGFLILTCHKLWL